MAPYSCSGQVKDTLQWVCLLSNYVCVLRRCPLFALIATQADLSHSESVFFIPGLQYIHFGVFLLALGWGNSVVKARRERKEGNYALTLGSRGLRSWN